MTARPPHYGDSPFASSVGVCPRNPAPRRVATCATHVVTLLDNTSLSPLSHAMTIASAASISARTPMVAKPFAMPSTTVDSFSTIAKSLFTECRHFFSQVFQVLAAISSHQPMQVEAVQLEAHINAKTSSTPAHESCVKSVTTKNSYARTEPKKSTNILGNNVRHQFGPKVCFTRTHTDSYGPISNCLWGGNNSNMEMGEQHILPNSTL
eukprot:3438853-Amphidinium_carterae.1